MQQKPLFSLPNRSEPTREQTKDVLSKINKPKPSTGATGGPVQNMLIKVNSTSNKIMQMVEIIRQTAGKELVDDGSYQRILTEVEFIAYIDAVISKGEAALDTEGTGLDPLVDRVVGICLYAPGLKPMYAPCDHTDVYGKRLTDQVSMECVTAQLKRLAAAGTKLYFHAAKYDIRMIRSTFGVRLLPAWCTLIGGNLLNENEPHGLKYLWHKYCNKTGKDTSSQTFGSLFSEDEYKLPFNYVPIDIAYLYAAKDPLMTYELAIFQMMYLKEEGAKCKQQQLIETASLFKYVELPLITVVADMEDEGICIDDKKAAYLSRKYNMKLLEVMGKLKVYLDALDLSPLQGMRDSKNKLLMDKLSPETVEVEIAGEKLGSVTIRISVGSSTQMAILMYDLFKLKSPDSSKPRGTGEEILESLRPTIQDESIKHFFNLLLEFRGIAKLLSTYIDKMPAIVYKSTGKIHGMFNQMGAKTGRFSSSGPNLQNIPAHGESKEIRKIFIPDPGMAFVGGDFSQQEPRILAHLCFKLFGDSRMVDSYIAGKDLYVWTASEVYQVPYEDCKEFKPDGTRSLEGYERRNSVKSIILGIMYGRGANAIAEQLGWTKEKAQQIVDMFFDTFPAVKQVIEYYQNMARTLGYVITVWGRKRRLPEINLPLYEVSMADGSAVDPAVADYYFNRMKKAWGNKQKAELRKEAEAQGIRIKDNGGKIADAERQCLNSVIQGSAADMTKQAMVAVGNDPELKELGFKMVLAVHDELIGKCPLETAVQAARRVEVLMIDSAADKISVPMKVDAEIVECWSGEDITDRLAA